MEWLSPLRLGACGGARCDSVWRAALRETIRGGGGAGWLAERGGGATKWSAWPLLAGGEGCGRDVAGNLQTVEDRCLAGIVEPEDQDANLLGTKEAPHDLRKQDPHLPRRCRQGSADSTSASRSPCRPSSLLRPVSRFKAHPLFDLKFDRQNLVISVFFLWICADQRRRSDP